MTVIVTRFEVNDHPTDPSRATAESSLFGLGVRAPLDDHEHSIVNAYRRLGSVAAIWIREVPAAPLEVRTTRKVWLQLSLWVPDDLRQLDLIDEEVKVRAMTYPWYTEMTRFVGDMPPSVIAIAPACVYRRP